MRDESYQHGVLEAKIDQIKIQSFCFQGVADDRISNSSAVPRVYPFCKHPKHQKLSEDPIKFIAVGVSREFGNFFFCSSRQTGFTSPFRHYHHHTSVSPSDLDAVQTTFVPSSPTGGSSLQGSERGSQGAGRGTLRRAPSTSVQRKKNSEIGRPCRFHLHSYILVPVVYLF